MTRSEVKTVLTLTYDDIAKAYEGYAKHVGVMEEYIKGRDIEELINGKWVLVQDPEFSMDKEYRVSTLYVQNWHPQKGEFYFLVCPDGEIACVKSLSDEIDESRYVFGNCFKTEAEAEEASKNIKELLLKYRC